MFVFQQLSHNKDNLDQRITILLIQPENREINRFRWLQFNNFSQLTMPYLAAFIDENRYAITLIDEYCQKIPYHIRFDLVAITVNTPNAPHCYAISKEYRRRGAKVIMGGPHVTLLPDEASAHCDYILVGEGEIIWKQFLDDYVEGNPQKRYFSIAIPSLANIPTPRWDLLKRNRIMKGALFATRGCPYNCRYCNLKQIYHNSFRMRPIDDVITEIQAIRSLFFVFWDDNLFADSEYAKSLLRAMIPLKRKWAAQTALKECVDDELLALTRKAGCMYLFLGLESFAADSLDDAGKCINRIADYKPVIKRIHEHGIMVQAGIVFGFDSDTVDVFDHTLTVCEELGIDGATISILTPFPKTPMYEQYKSEGRLSGQDWSQYNSKTAVAFTPKNMTAAELFAGYNRFRRRFYSLKSFFRRMCKSRTNIPVNFILNLGYRLGV